MHGNHPRRRLADLFARDAELQQVAAIFVFRDDQADEMRPPAAALESSG
jgi:hypothetical protein